ncbi:hypothetical protein niasHT_024136 [Heterodera trifolii]|uniref:Uncharacterized protein n=1 Tax=Heterodera trifolii TaxID=157864 RepID=A0ABD2KQL7_9BILA
MGPHSVLMAISHKDKYATGAYWAPATISATRLIRRVAKFGSAPPDRGNASLMSLLAKQANSEQTQPAHEDRPRATGNGASEQSHSVNSNRFSYI